MVAQEAGSEGDGGERDSSLAAKDSRFDAALANLVNEADRPRLSRAYRVLYDKDA